MNEAEAVNNPLAIWNSVQDTDQKFTKPFTRGGGFKGTAINPCYTVKRLTDTFGPNGVGWAFIIDNEQYVSGSTLRNGDKTVVHIIRGHIAFRYNGEWVHGSPQFGQTTFVGENSSNVYTDEEAPKKSVTDCLTKCAVLLGFSADIHLGLRDGVGAWDANKYVNDPNVKAAGGKKSNPFREPAGGSAPPAYDDGTGQPTNANPTGQLPTTAPKDRRPKAAPPPPTSSKAVEVPSNSPQQLLEFAEGLNRAVYAPEDWEEQCRAIANRKREIALPEAAETVTLNAWLRDQRAYLDSFTTTTAPAEPAAATEPKKRGRPAGSKNKKIDEPSA